MQTRTLGQLAEHVGGKVFGDGGIEIKSVATLDAAGEGDISFLANLKYEKQVQSTKASAVIAGKKIESNAALLIAEDPYYALMQIVVLLYGYRKHVETGISGRASIAESAQIGEGCHINDFATVSDKAKIGARCVLYPGAFVGAETRIGDDCILYPNAVVYDHCKVGNRVIIQANATVGEDGFGFSTHNDQHLKIPHIGSVILEDDVEIGAGSGIERGTLDNTVIGKGTKIGDLVAIGHGTKVGPYCLLVAQVGVAGSVTLGHHCIAGGQAGIAGHIKIGNMVQMGAQSGIHSSLEDGKVVLGTPALDVGLTRRIWGTFKNLPDMHRSIKKIEKRLANLEGNDKS